MRRAFGAQNGLIIERARRAVIARREIATRPAINLFMARVASCAAVTVERFSRRSYRGSWPLALKSRIGRSIGVGKSAQIFFES